MHKNTLAIGIAMMVIGVVLLVILQTDILIKNADKNEITIESNSNKGFGYPLEKGDKMKLTVDADNQIEIFFCNENDYKKLINNQEDAGVKKYSSIAKTKGEVYFIAPEPGLWYVVFQNTGDKKVKINYKIDVVQYVPTSILFYSGILFLTMGCVMIPASFFAKKKKEEYFVPVDETEEFIEVQEEQIPTQLLCRNCKRVVDNPEQYYLMCPFCGRSLR